MITFKQFFETVYDVWAAPADSRGEGDVEVVGQADDATLDKIRTRSRKYVQNADKVMWKFLKTIGFDDDNYKMSLEAVLDAHQVDYIQFAKFLSRSKSRYSDFKRFTGANQGDFFSIVEPRIVGGIESRSGEATGLGVANAYQFYNDLCKIAHPQGRVGVGEGEFMLAVLTEGKKGETGDISTMKAGGKEYEIGTQKKIISKGIKDIVKFTVPVTRQSQVTVGNIWDPQGDKKLHWTVKNMNQWIYFKEADMDVKFGGLEKRAKKLADEERASGIVDFEKRRRIFCSCVLHKYITSHKDDCIIVFNGGGAGTYGVAGRVSKAIRGELSGPEYRAAERASTEFKHCRWLQLGENAGKNLEWVFKKCVDSNWFDFEFDSDLKVRIKYTPASL